MTWKLADLQDFHDDAAQAHKDYDALARDVVRTLPPEEWPVWVKNRYRMWNHGPTVPIKLPNPPDPMDEPGKDTFPEDWLAKVAAGFGIPADYTPDDPYDIGGKMPLINAMQVEWWDMPPDQAKQVIINAFRATMLSPRMNLKSNAILYQSLMHIPAEESDPDVFENAIRNLKARWDTQGQGELGQDPEDIIDPNEILPGKFMPGFWGNIRRLAGLGPFADEIYKAAMDDINHGGTGQIFRNRILDLGIPGVQAKVASFAWLALAPNSSELATIDVHMMKHLNEPGDSPRNTNHYLELENKLRDERDETYGTEVPLSHYQWGVWDARRTPGFHQDHTPLRAYQPTSFRDVAWPTPSRPPRTRVPMSIPEGQQSLLGRWSMRGRPDAQTIFEEFVAKVLAQSGITRLTEETNDWIYSWLLEETHGQIPYDDPKSYNKLVQTYAKRLQDTTLGLQNQIPGTDYRQNYINENFNGVFPRKSNWMFTAAEGYTVQGKVVSGAKAVAQGIAVRPDKQNKAEIMEIINNLSTHADDIQRQRKMIPEWAINRGGKVAAPPTAQQPFGLGPGAGFTYHEGVVCVSEWIDVDDNWLLLHPACIGIVAQKGGASSHGAIVALQRNIAIVVDVPEAAKIHPGDRLQVSSETAIISVNGGSAGQEFGEAQIAEVPLFRFVWSQGQGRDVPIPQDDPEGGVLHRQLIMEQFRAGHWDQVDSALGVIYSDGRVQMVGEPSDQEAMVQWLNTIHPITQIETGFAL